MKTRLLTCLAALALGLSALAPRLRAASYYTTEILKDNPLLYWNFDEDDGNALQLAALTPALVTTENDLVPVNGASRVTHVDIGGLPKLGRAADFSGTDFFQAAALRAGRANLSPPWAFEFWMQVQGDNSGNRADYLMNFGNAGADNGPALIYDFEADTLEIFGGGAGRTANSPIIADTNWHHVVWIYYGDGVAGVANRCDLWVDGANFGNVRDTFSRAIKLNERLLVGAATAAADNGFQGRLDELAIYDLSSYGDEWGVSDKATQLVGDHFLEATTETGNAYMDAVLADSPLLYWNFDEASGNALQKAPVTLPLPNNDSNQLVPQAAAARLAHDAMGSGFALGNAIDLHGADSFQATTLDAGLASLPAPWAVEFWMQVQGANVIGSGERQDYLLDFGTNPDNSPAFIYDYKPDQLEIFAGVRTDSGPVIRDNHWHHIIWVFYGDTTVGVGDGVEAFVDGINLGRNVRNTYTRSLKLSNMLLVGAAAPNGVGGFEGRMDEVAIYNLAGLGSQAAVRTKVSLMASNHFLAAYGPPGDAAITITQQPADQTVQKGGTATFTVAVLVFGAPPESLAYQWMRNGSPISGATEASYTTPILSLDDLGTTIYAVRVSTIGGVFVLSREAILTVPVPPQEETYYASQVRQDGAFLYWNFDENGGNALQCAPLGAPPAVTTENDLVPVAGATRVDSTGKLGRAASLNGANYYQAAALRAGKASLAAPWAVEFWMQVSGPNTDNRADYLLNFGNGGVDNVPAFIYDYEPDTLEVYSNAGRTSNSPLIADTRWHHVLWVFYGDGNAGVANRCNLWVDGAAFGNVRANFSRPITVNERLLVGAATAAGVGGFEGALDELAVYDLSALPNEAAITAKAQSLASHYTAASSADPQPYAEVILAEQPVLYWNFDEADGNARQLAPITLPPFNNSQNELVPFLGATRVEHSLAGSGLFLGNAASFSGLNFFQALDLDTAKATLSAPWAVEFWMQVTGNNSANRADYLMNFGNPDNAPAFIYDFKPDQLEVFGGAGGRSDNGPTLADNNWHHVMWVFYGDGVTGVADRLEAWVDGQNLGNARANYSRPISVNARLIVGAATPGGDNAFEGRLDEIAVYDLGNLATEAEVVTHVQDLVTRHLGAAANPPAVLKLTRSGDEITISWSRTGFVLQENADAANPAGWTDVPGGSASPVVITMPATGNKFYRLRSQ